MLLFPKVPLILWIGYKPSTRCGRVHFEHSHRKWLVITVRPTTSVRESPQKNLPPRNTPDQFCRRFTRQNHRCAAWAVFFFFTNKILCSCSIFQNLFFVVDCTTVNKIRRFVQPHKVLFVKNTAHAAQRWILSGESAAK